MEATNTLSLQALREVGKIIGDVTFVKGISDIRHLLVQYMSVVMLAVDFFFPVVCNA